MMSIDQLKRQYFLLLKKVEQKQNNLRRLDREFEDKVRVYEQEADALAQLKEGKLQEENDEKLQQLLRTKCWQAECNAILLKKDNILLKKVFDKREYLIRLGLLESRLRKIVENLASMKEARAGIESESGKAKAREEACQTLFEEQQQLFSKLKSLYVDLKTIDDSIKCFVDKTLKFPARAAEAEYN